VATSGYIRERVNFLLLALEIEAQLQLSQRKDNNSDNLTKGIKIEELSRIGAPDSKTLYARKESGNY
jgi:hypothetical protein